jgi:mannose-6-phosphate isomerase-like protein (cupin superfamily)
MIEKIMNGSEMIAFIVSHSYNEKGIHFFTPNDFSQQLAHMSHPVGQIIEPHVHNPIRREVHYTQEVLFIKKGRVRVDFYDEKQTYLTSRILESGDVILLATGGHGFQVLEELEMIEVKQGPYAGDSDKTRFKGIGATPKKMEG